jgi:ABC-type branched-subunit amino acid transport system ATPase component
MVVVLVEAEALVEAEVSDAALVLVAGAEVMAGEDLMDPLTGPHTLALLALMP